MLTTNEIVNKYLEKLNINYEINTLEDITKLIKAHLRTCPFSSLKVLLNEEINLDLYTVYKSLLEEKRGGYCFEHNKLMYEVLKNLGFDVSFHLARVIKNTDINLPPQTHRFTVLNYEDEKYLIDVGIGFRTPSVPIRFYDEEVLSHLNTPYKIVKNKDETFSMQRVEKNVDFRVTKFDLSKCYEVDFEMGNFYSYKNKNAVFQNNFVISRIEQNIHYSLANDKYFHIKKDETEEIEIKDSEHLEKIVKEDFNLNFTKEEVNYFYNRFLKKDN